ncbi:MAG: hypothetical protein P4L33_01530 [Capsulimonadaceae bacterium]|nr:hypothetical protein [Capsulimonadaceae bacterium]
MSQVVYKAIHPIGESNPLDMPVRNIDTAGVWYEMRLEFRSIDRDQNRRTLRMMRDDVVLELAENGRDPEQESCYIEVSDVEAARIELDQHETNPTEIRDEKYGDANYRVFFIRDPDGLCYCIGQKQP